PRWPSPRWRTARAPSRSCRRWSSPTARERAGRGSVVDLADRLALLRLEAVLGAAVGPVAGDRDLVALDSALLEESADQLDGLPLAVGEDLDTALGPGTRLHDGGQQLGRRAALRAGRPDDLDVLRRGQLEAVRLGID